jgi:hypothetical protein
VQYSSATVLPTAKCRFSIHAFLHSLHPPYKLPQKNENDYNELFISILAHMFPINLNTDCYYAIKIPNISFITMSTLFFLILLSFSV